MVLSMVFGCCGLFPLELCSLLERKPCLANTLPEVCKGLHKPPKGRKSAKHGFLYSAGLNPQEPTRPKTENHA